MHPAAICLRPGLVVDSIGRPWGASLVSETLGFRCGNLARAGRQLRPTNRWRWHAGLTVWLRCLAIVRLVAAGFERDRLDPVGESDFRFATGPHRGFR